MFTTHFQPEYLTSDLISGAVVHCFSTRRGGVSTGYLSSLNLGVHRGDHWDNVYENYRRLGAAVGFAPEQTVFTRQTHTDVVARVGAAECKNLGRRSAHRPTIASAAASGAA